MRVFLDASALVPMSVPRDHWRPLLSAEMAALHRGGVPDFVTTTWTIYEALAIAKRSGHAFAVDLWRQSRAFEAVATVSHAVEAEAVFKQNCMACHGENLEGRSEQTNLQTVGGRMTAAAIKKQIEEGGGGMPAFEGTLSEAQISALTDWLFAKK